MKKKYVIMYIMLLVVPALFIGAMATRWLKHEHGRLRRMAEAALEEQAGTLAGHLDLLLHDITSGAMDDLVQIPLEAPDVMRRWRDSHPFVRQVFIWHPVDGVLLPDLRWANAEEEAFVMRYDALFSGRRVWPVAQPDGESMAAASSVYAIQRARREVTRRSVRQETVGKLQVAVSSGWLPWFWERDAHLLGWVRSAADGIMRGIELELLAVYARFQPFFVTTEDAVTDFALYDNNGEIVMQTAGYEQWHGLHPAVFVPVSRLLPHWRIGAVPAYEQSAVSFAWLSGLLLAILLVAILAGGGMLAWLGQRDYHDALRKTTFVSNVSHELKTPLTTIRMYADMLREKRVNESKRETYLAVITDESMRLSRLVNNVLDFSRLEQGRKTYSREKIDLADFISQITTMHSDRLYASGIKLKKLNMPAMFAEVFSDRDALEQALLNLLDNAVKYAVAGGEVSVALEDSGAFWNIEVADRGPGVPSGLQERIFGSFYRIDDSLTSRSPGSGLGLSIGRRLMRELGGDLVYRPNPGGGAVFVMLVKKEAVDA